jgi:REP element-mobilizing transposase RayT
MDLLTHLYGTTITNKTGKFASSKSFLYRSNDLSVTRQSVRCIPAGTLTRSKITCCSVIVHACVRHPCFGYDEKSRGSFRFPWLESVPELWNFIQVIQKAFSGSARPVLPAGPACLPVRTLRGCFAHVRAVALPVVRTAEVMPHDFHGIINIRSTVGAIHELRQRELPQRERRRMTIPLVIGYFKMNTAKRINKILSSAGIPVWQRNYYEHIIRNEAEQDRIHRYIESNVADWDMDNEHEQHVK